MFPYQRRYIWTWIYSKWKWKNNIHKQWKENDRIGILQLNPPNITEPKKYTNPIYKKAKLVKRLRMKRKIEYYCNLITIINCYAEHSELMKKKTEDTEIFYEHLDKLVNK